MKWVWYFINLFLLSIFGMFCPNLFIWKKLNFKALLSSFCFSARNLNYVKKAKTLEELKTESSFPDKAFQQGKYILLLRTEFICTEGSTKLLWKNFQDIKSLISDEPQKILLDISYDVNIGDICLFALDLNITENEHIAVLESKTGGKFLNARESLLKLDDSDCQYVAQAKGLSHFNKTFNFCPNCGNKLVGNAIGTVKHCSECKQAHYPHVAPVGIVLLEDTAHEKVLLTRQSRHPPGMFSCVAGFLEPGESLYQGIKREVAEEVGLTLAKVEFFNSQHWAMPSSQLMLACVGTVDSENFDLDGKEIEKAMWVQADTLREAISRVNSFKSISTYNGKDLWVPPPFTASHQLMVDWLNRYHPS